MSTDDANASPYVQPSDWQRVIDAERQLIGGELTNTTALAISGGGIRSASFALGVMQALVNGKVMPHVHYLSTVSGGGYLGSSLTWFLNRGLPGRGKAGLSEDDFPFGIRQSSRAGADSKRNQLLDYIRQHACYLVPTGSLGLASFVAVVVRAMLVSLLVYFALLTTLMCGLRKLGLFDPVPAFAAIGAGSANNLALLLALALAALFVAFSLAYALATRIVSRNEYGLRTWGQRLFGWTAMAALGCALLGALPLVPHWIQHTMLPAMGITSTGFGAVLGFFEFLKQHRGQQPQAAPDEKPGVLASARPVVGAASVVFGLLLLSYLVAGMVFPDAADTDVKSRAANVPLAIAIAVTLVLGLLINVNYLGLHRMYRDRLMELFMPDRATLQSGRWNLARDADAACIDGFCRNGDKPQLPYHLINTNVVLVDSNTASYRGRGGDNFILSPLFCGSGATGWRSSAQYMKQSDANGKARGRGMTLPTAMAISGAAVNPNSGVGGRGTTRSRMVSTLLALLNLRLGYWAPNPQRALPRRAATPPNFVEPGLRGGVFGGGMHEGARVVELTDGGHFENLAVYELIRRRVPYIFVCDGGQDGRFTFEDLANLTERVRVDFGAKLDFDDEELGLDGLKPGSAGASAAAAIASSALAARGFAIGSIRYDGDPRDKPSGTLIYFKSTLTPALSADLYGYKNANPDFPHESTGDQFFDEVQFEAYRELGYHLGWQWLEANQTKKFWVAPTPSVPPPSLGTEAQPTAPGATA